MWDNIDKIRKVVQQSSSLKNAIEQLGYKNGGTTRVRLKQIIEDHCIDTSHFTPTKRVGKSGFDDAELLQKVVAESKSIAEVIRKMGMVGSGASYKVVHNRIRKFQLSIDHFSPHEHNRKRITKLDLVDILVENSTYDRKDLKRRLIAEGVLEYKCGNCHNTGNWMGTPLVLQLEHCNGINNDNRLENLCFLCPNCHSQTPTYAGKNSKINFN